MILESIRKSTSKTIISHAKEKKKKTHTHTYKTKQFHML